MVRNPYSIAWTRLDTFESCRDRTERFHSKVCPSIVANSIFCLQKSAYSMCSPLIWNSWFFKCTTRGDAERLLLAEDNPRGTFLIRPAESRIDQFSLSVKEWIPDAGFQVRHYKINVAKDGYFIRKDHVFPTLNALVQAHRREFTFFFKSVFLSDQTEIFSLTSAWFLGISPRLLPVLSKPCPKVQPSAPPALPAQQPAPLGFNYQIMFFVIIIYFFLFSLSQKFQGN